MDFANGEPVRLRTHRRQHQTVERIQHGGLPGVAGSKQQKERLRVAILDPGRRLEKQPLPAAARRFAIDHHSNDIIPCRHDPAVGNIRTTRQWPMLKFGLGLRLILNRLLNGLVAVAMPGLIPPPRHRFLVNHESLRWHLTSTLWPRS